MGTHTTLTDIRRIRFLDKQGDSLESIADKAHVDVAEIARILEASKPKKRARKKTPEPITEPITETAEMNIETVFNESK